MSSASSAGDRDRDATGRARNARPRDSLGRPLPYGSVDIARQPEGVVRSPDETIVEAQRLLDADLPFHTHEVFEDAWKSSVGDDRALWKGLAQLAVGLTHLGRGNVPGATALLRRGRDAVAAFDDRPPYGLDITGITGWADGLIAGLRSAQGSPAVDWPAPVLRSGQVQGPHLERKEP